MSLCSPFMHSDLFAYPSEIGIIGAIMNLSPKYIDDSPQQIRAAMERPHHFLHKFPLLKKNREQICPLLFLKPPCRRLGHQTGEKTKKKKRLLFTKRLSATIIIFSPVEYLPNLWQAGTQSHGGLVQMISFSNR